MIRMTPFLAGGRNLCNQIIHLLYNNASKCSSIILCLLSDNTGSAISTTLSPLERTFRPDRPRMAASCSSFCMGVR
jgi:hypothetical protein